MSICYEVDGTIAVITIDRTEAMNALDRDHNDLLADAFARFEADQALRVAVLTGAGGKSFCAGADLSRLLPSFRDAVRAGQSPQWAFGGITAEAQGGKPKIAAVNGHALAGGLEMALACDIRLASPNARFGLAETKLAIIPGAGGTQRLPRTVPLGVAMEMILSGEPIGADDAFRWGLVNRVVPLERLRDEAVALAHSIAARGPLAVQSARAAIMEGLSLGLAAGLEMERERFMKIMRTDDAAEGAAAFMEKRPPRYQGK
jgi:enoyl-CoA hydratase/carnithine racemase